jgi:hypothetical protein
VPVEVCELGGDPGFRWGSKGKCYTYEPGDESGRESARERAERQGRAAHAAGYASKVGGPVATRQGAQTLVLGIALIKRHIEKQKDDLAPEEALKLLHQVQHDAADAVDKAWQRTMGLAIRQATSKPLTTGAKALDAIRHVEQTAERFGKSKELGGILRETIEASYAFGILHIWNRFKIIEARQNPPKVNLTIRPVIPVARLTEPVRKAKPAFAKITGEVNFTLVDEKAIDSLYKSSQTWVTDDYGFRMTSPGIRDHIRSYAEDLIETGDAARAGAGLRAKMEAIYGTEDFVGRSRSYWAGVVENAATNAGVRGQLNEMTRLGFTRYEVVNPMDERTTEVCALMNGKTMLVSDAQTSMVALDGAKSPRQIKEVKPFVSGGRSDDVKDVLSSGALPSGPAELSASDSGKLNAAGFGTPPYHFRCRSYIDVFYDETVTVEPVVQPIPPSKRKPGKPMPPPLPGAAPSVDPRLTPTGFEHYGNGTKALQPTGDGFDLAKFSKTFDKYDGAAARNVKGVNEFGTITERDWALSHLGGNF